jgi:hypothetical protein
MMGYNIISPKDIGNYIHDVIVVTSYAYEETILGNLERIGCDMTRVERFFVRGL